MKKVMVTGCFDLLHSGHVAFLQEAARLGELYVCIGSDANVRQLKGRYPVNPQVERKFMLEALGCVQSVRVNRGSGILDFVQELDAIRPDIFFVNEDGHTPAKEALCQARNIEYVVSRRTPAGGLPQRSTTALRVECTIPYRIDLAGGWLDQPWVSALHPGAVLTISIEPTYEFNDRSGMASSTRKKAIELWRTALPGSDPEQTAKMLFACDNPPGTTEVSGSQDAIGIVMPGLNKLNYAGHYWPESIESVHDEPVLHWLEQHLYLVTLGPRTAGYQALADTHITTEGAQRLAGAAEDCWQAILKCDLPAFGDAFRRSFEAQVAMFPNMADPGIFRMIEQYRHQAPGWKLSGAGGGGYLILVAEKPLEHAIQVKIRRREGG
ncbi:MAG: adenylyltransferase/cytidyltransferase family protein [Saprospirales bacterium]|nr:adenylyltransferase/cytidyltransferase family protein [Saprospirales bacterium]MBK8922432.1 adenylyltransferase/cytidyltransferase family protein [Saprospirales bacterium]